MIKKIFLGLGLFLLSIISFSSAGYIRQIGVYGYSPYDNSFDLNVLPKGVLLTQKLGRTKNVLYFQDSADSKFFFFWDENGLPYMYFLSKSRQGRIGSRQGQLMEYYICDEINENVDGLSNCSINTVGSDSFSVFESFLSTLTSSDFWYFDQGFYQCYYQDYFYGDVAFSSHSLGKTLKFSINEGSSSCSSTVHVVSLSGSLGFGSDISFDSLSYGILGDSPGVGGNSGGGGNINGGIEIGSDISAIEYFEGRYGWDSSICYAGISNLTALYGDPVSFEEGQGLNIFQVFSGLYGNSSIDKVYVWLNSWLINYDQWFERSEPLYLSNYNSGTNQVDLYYTGFTFPFANNPVAIYFLTDNIYNRSEYKTQGSEIVSYCNIKINSGSFSEIIDPAVKNNIDNYTELINVSKGLNPDGTRRDFDNIGAFLTSGTDLAFSGNTTIKNTLENFFNDLDETLSAVNSVSTSNRILPSWLVTAFLFVVLFKLLRKK